MAAVFSALTSDTVEKLALGLIVLLIVGAVLVIRSSVKLYTKVALVVVLGGVGIALFQNRVELGRCSRTCACTIYGHDVEVPHLPFSCEY